MGDYVYEAGAPIEAELRREAIPTVPERLELAARIFRDRDQLYGSSYKEFGNQFFDLVKGFKLDSPDALNRFALFLHMCDKLRRYAAQFNEGGHPDSLDDISVYAQMLAEMDEVLKL